MGMGGEVSSQTAGYSGTPLAKKLGIKPGYHIKLVNPPAYYLSLFTDLPGDISINNENFSDLDFIHFFTKSEEEYLDKLPILKKQLKQDGVIWASWPKKSSKLATDITEEKIRKYAIQIGLVDIKVCAVDDTWSGLKLVIPVKDRVNK
jgi:hypothetical protein